MKKLLFPLIAIAMVACTTSEPPTAPIIEETPTAEVPITPLDYTTDGSVISLSAHIKSVSIVGQGYTDIGIGNPTLGLKFTAEGKCKLVFGSWGAPNHNTMGHFYDKEGFRVTKIMNGRIYFTYAHADGQGWSACEHVLYPMGLSLNDGGTTEYFMGKEGGHPQIPFEDPHAIQQIDYLLYLSVH